MSVEEKMPLVALRMRMDMTQEEVAKAVGVSKPTYAKWEHNADDITFKNMEKLAEVLKYPRENIYFGDLFAFVERMRKLEA